MNGIKQGWIDVLINGNSEAKEKRKEKKERKPALASKKYQGRGGQEVTWPPGWPVRWHWPAPEPGPGHVPGHVRQDHDNCSVTWLSAKLETGLDSSSARGLASAYFITHVALLGGYYLLAEQTISLSPWRRRLADAHLNMQTSTQARKTQDNAL